MGNPKHLNPQAPNLGRENFNELPTTANLDAGLTGLWRIGRRMCLQSLAWKLLEDLKKSGIGTNEVESEAAKREWKRTVKKGMKESFKEFSKRGDKRDQKYVCGLLNLRAKQAKETE